MIYIYIYTYSLVICYIAIENGPLIVDLPIKYDDCPELCEFIRG